jgi:hypothetical protein
MRTQNLIGSLRWLAVIVLATAVAACGGGGDSTMDDGTATGVSSVSPANNAISVALDSSVRATFSGAIDPATVNPTTFTVIEAGLTPVAGSVAVQGQTATFTPSGPLAPSTTYVSRVKGGAAGVKDPTGTPLPVDVVWQWTTAAAVGDTTPPTVVSTVPDNFANPVCTGQPISARFSEAIDPLTINSATFTLELGTTPVAGVPTFDPVTRTASFTPGALLQGPGTIYTARLRGGASGVKDLAGNPLAFDRVWTFTTGGPCP